MSNPQNPLDQFEEKDKTLSDELKGMAMKRAEDAAGDFVKNAPKRFLRRFVWSFILSFTMVDEFEKRRLLNRVERGGNITLHEALFGSKFSIGGCISSIIFGVIVLGIVFYLWQQGALQQMWEATQAYNAVQ